MKDMVIMYVMYLTEFWFYFSYDENNFVAYKSGNWRVFYDS